MSQQIDQLRRGIETEEVEAASGLVGDRLARAQREWCRDG
ncbi:hypothetical protein BH09ACT3_BH09ACT3_08160 [soil metagenome]